MTGHFHAPAPGYGRAFSIGIALTVHLVMCGGYPGDEFLGREADELHHDSDIECAAIQIETAAQICGLANHA